MDTFYMQRRGGQGATGVFGGELEFKRKNDSKEEFNQNKRKARV